MRINKLFAAMSCALLGAACTGEISDSDVQETIENLEQAGFPRSDIQVYDGVVYVGNDAEVTLESSREMIQAGAANGNEEQYRTNNLVSRALSTICIRGHAAPQYNANAVTVLANGLVMAMANYNALNLTFTMRYVGEGQSTAGCGAMIEAYVENGTGGRAGFPSGGRPYGAIYIGIGVANYGVDVAEHVITHELGHAVGFRHTDFFNRSISCGGSPVNEGQAGVGAIHIPGTPTGAQVGGSIMNSCFRSVETGEFTASDAYSLRLGYGR
ncbi:MAG: M57 family metalloprotease [Kofleriaceae bacterium]